MPMPIDGIRVIDWTIWQQGPVEGHGHGNVSSDFGPDGVIMRERSRGHKRSAVSELLGYR